MEIVRANSCVTPIITIHGAEGRGKTTLASHFPKPLYFLFERGLPRGVEVDAVQGVETFDGVMGALGEIWKDLGEYRTLVFDTLDALEPLLLEHVCAENKWQNIETPSYGKGYVAADTCWRRFLSALAAIRNKHSITIVLICHTSIERVDDPRAPTYTSYQLKLHKRARALVMDASDMVGFLAEDLRVITHHGGFRDRTRAASGDGRYLFVEGRPAFAAKNRFGMPAKVQIPLDLNISELSKYWQPKGAQ
jgi:AAA domain